MGVSVSCMTSAASWGPGEIDARARAVATEASFDGALRSLVVMQTRDKAARTT